MIVHWGRVNRGRVWHILVDDGVSAMCDPGRLAVEVTEGQPPLGGFVCPSCKGATDDLFKAVTEAIRRQRPHHDPVPTGP
jgi:hypothetical protein